MRYAIFETEAGFCGLGWSGAGIARFQLPGRDAAGTERMLRRRLPPGAVAAEPEGEIAAAVAAVRRYFAGEAVDFSGLAVDLAGAEADFVAIYGEARRLGWGETATYGELAKRLGRGPEAARDVGQAMARNPVALIIPCHRVLAAGGKLGGFSAPGGAETKRRMLALEGVSVGQGQGAFAF